jgi:hypothetical protein
MAQDRADGDHLPLTHEALALMLGVRRAGVTTALHLLEARGFISTGRGSVSIVDRAGLEEEANGLYGIPEAEFNRLFQPLGAREARLYGRHEGGWPQGLLRAHRPGPGASRSRGPSHLSGQAKARI